MANQHFTTKDFRTTSGVQLDLTLAYRTFGDASLPCILHPTCFGGKIETALGLIQPRLALDPAKYFVVVVALLSNGESSSPSNTPAPYSGPDFPRVTYLDNVRLQRKLLTSLGISTLFAVVGFSMGAQCTYTWAAAFPSLVQRAVAICGSASTSWHNWNFLEGPRNALINARDFHDGRYTTPPAAGLKAFGRAYSAWALSPAWYTAETWRRAKEAYGNKSGGFDTVEQYLQAGWDKWEFDANDLLCLLNTWQLGSVGIFNDIPQDANVAENDGNDAGVSARASDSAAFKTRTIINAVLEQRVTAHVLIMPSSSDAYFPQEDSISERRALGRRPTTATTGGSGSGSGGAGGEYPKKAQLSIIDTDWGHLAGGGGLVRERDFMSSEIERFFADTTTAGANSDNNNRAAAASL